MLSKSDWNAANQPMRHHILKELFYSTKNAYVGPTFREISMLYTFKHQLKLEGLNIHGVCDVVGTSMCLTN